MRMAQTSDESWKTWRKSLKALRNRFLPRRPTVRAHGDGLEDGR
jgi:hypothetical protein